MKNVSSISMLSLFMMAIISTNVEAKVFRFKNEATGQVMSVHCFFPNSIQCQEKKDEVIRRLKENSNPDQTTLSGARASDFGNNVKNETVDAANQAKDNASNMANTVKDGAIDLGSNIKEGAVNLGNSLSEKAQGASEYLQNGAQNISDKAANMVNSAKGKTYRVKVPGYEHSMTFHCRGGLDSKECVEEKAVVVAAIKGGSEAESLEEFRLSPLYKAKDAVVNTAEGIGQKVGDFVSEEKHNYCKRKLERHAKDFDQQYEATETQLVSYQEKLNYIEKSLVEEGKFETCQDHFEQAVLGYQLKWIQRGEVAQEKTHIFDGLGRLADGGVGYWKNEDRSGYESSANAM